MTITKNTQTASPFLTIVCCQHGNEPFGKDVFDLFASCIHEFPGLQLILANEEALAIDKRGVEGDLNRSFPGNQNGNHEARLAYHILPLLQSSQYVLDVHTSVSSCGFLVPIIAKQNPFTESVINLLDESSVVLVKQPLADTSLIGNVEGGLSLEFQKTLADEHALQTTMNLVRGLYAKTKRPPQDREVFVVTGILSKELALPLHAKDFTFIPELNLYPVLLKEASYMGNQGLMATEKYNVQI